ncbi:MAG TPA: HD domain-containing phosphohydrolase [Gaiellaceae bacterium]|jgi:putative two-component system response regulator
MSRVRVLCVDDDPHVRSLIQRMVIEAGYDCAGAGTVADARTLLAQEEFSVVLCDIGLPGQSGFELLDELGRSRPDIATVVVSGHDHAGIVDAALALGAYGYVTKPFTANELMIDISNALHRRRYEAERREAADSALQRAYAGTLSRLSRAVEYHDGATGSHLERVGTYTAEIAGALDLPEAEVELLRLAAPLHDIGKIAIRDRILRKTGMLTDEERALMEQHTDIGRDLLGGSGSDLLELAATIAWTHHERWNGSGYPRGLEGDAIPLAGRIVAVADVFDALSSDRPYRPRLSVSEARAWIVDGSGRAFDPDVVDAFVRSLAAVAA